VFDDRYVGDGEPPQSDRRVCPVCGEEVKPPEIGYHDRCLEQRWQQENRD
jgi:hypothetical protein